MLMTEYETTVVVRPDIGGDAIEATLDKVRDAVKGRGGKLLAIEHWGKKKLAYPIKKHSRGIYVQTHYLAGGDTVAEVERNLRIADSVLRFLTIRLGDDVDPGTRDEKEYVVPQYDIEEPTEEEEAQAAEADAGAEAAEPAAEAGAAEPKAAGAEAAEPAAGAKAAEPAAGAKAVEPAAEAKAAEPAVEAKAAEPAAEAKAVEPAAEAKAVEPAAEAKAAEADAKTEAASADESAEAKSSDETASTDAEKVEE